MLSDVERRIGMSFEFINIYRITLSMLSDVERRVGMYFEFINLTHNIINVVRCRKEVWVHVNV